ncbi:phosphoenolpyruvate phosphomutase-domain-containing protein [Poronia punctata]|nr:phosphoenolpyruvate phosphomutase-domain-containing protein [Poronia punctata]
MASHLRSVLASNNGQLRLCEVHDRASIELVRAATADDGSGFEGVWVSGLTQTTYLGIPDTELISPLERALLMTPIPKPVRNDKRKLCAAFDADSGGSIPDIPALVTALSIKGISMIIIEDKAVTKPGEKVNSLLATSHGQGQADMHVFAETIRAFKAVAANRDIMITARIESFTTRPTKQDPAEEQASVQAALRDALARAKTYRQAGVDAIMIHSKSKQPDEVIQFLQGFRAVDATMPLVVVPTAYSRTERTVLAAAGANIFIYANHLIRAKVKAATEVFEEALARTPDLLAGEEDLRACLEARNYGCLLRLLAERRYLGEPESELHRCGVEAEKRAVANMQAAVQGLASGRLCGCEADDRIITVKELLGINAKQVCPV